ncbi:MAG: glycoside hydrolase family 88 protein [Micromonosporaceae bacterium]
MPGTRLTDVVEVARHCRTPIWGFGVGGCLSGLVAAGEVLRRPELVEEVAGRVGGGLTQPADHLISVETLLALRGRLPAAGLDAACERWSHAILKAPRPVPGLPRVHRPDLPEWRDTIWVDCMHTDGPGLAMLGFTDEAVAYAEEYAAALQRDDGLFHHGYDVAIGRGNGCAWGRGQGWALLGLVDTLRLAGDTGLRERLARLLETLNRYRRPDGWGTLVDDPDAPVEHSVAGYVALGTARALAAGLVDPGYADLADHAWACTLRHLDGGALEVSRATPVGRAEDYRTTPTGVYAWGQAPVLQGLLERGVRT